MASSTSGTSSIYPPLEIWGVQELHVKLIKDKVEVCHMHPSLTSIFTMDLETCKKTLEAVINCRNKINGIIVTGNYRLPQAVKTASKSDYQMIKALIKRIFRLEKSAQESAAVLG